MKLPITLIKKLSPLLFGLISGFCVFYFLYFFKAYGIQEGLSYSGHSHLFRSLSYGVLTLVYITLLEQLLRPKLKIRSLPGKFLWYVFLILLGCQLVFILFNFFWDWQEWNSEAYGLIIKEYPLMMVLAFLLYFTIASLIKQKKPNEIILSFSSENGKDHLKIKMTDFLFAEAMENYVAIFFIPKETVKRHLIRKPLKIVTNELKDHKNIFRIHRSYLVNTNKITSVKQTKGKVLITIGEMELIVSKRHHEQFLTAGIIHPK